MPHQAIAVTLFGAPGCHLCDEAQALLGEFQRNGMLTVMHVNAHSTFELIQRYGNRIPVLQFPDGEELGWPFSRDDIQQALERSS